jgi:hypothetical protein
MTIEHAEILRVTAYRILHEQGSAIDPVLLLTTAKGDHHFVLNLPLIRKLAASCEKAGREST